ncbi:translocase SEC61 gamma subunit [Cordyceps militaris]|uniref:Translocase SEC61 gamma subunit n=1 Tax=Cordyceps militaris TaxID=73501 RepID=A0A2H4SJD5_CORMI|nr:translocase SEC61 gamma subunit [Cordyceps militaris]
MADHVENLIDVPKEFIREGIQFMNKCQKPDRKEFIKISQAIAMGFVAMGTVGYLVKLIHIPINNILVAGA